MTPPYHILPAGPERFAELAAIWEASVRATHHFLSEEDILYFRPRIEQEYLYGVQVHALQDAAGHTLGFLGTSGTKVEMLFIDPRYRGSGAGKTLLRFAIDRLGARQLDVNEQNEQAVGFYKHIGFTIAGRSEVDGLGKPYPILHLQLDQAHQTG